VQPAERVAPQDARVVDQPVERLPRQRLGEALHGIGIADLDAGLDAHAERVQCLRAVAAGGDDLLAAAGEQRAEREPDAAVGARDETMSHVVLLVELQCLATSIGSPLHGR
jgi:hypothetical protein